MVRVKGSFSSGGSKLQAPQYHTIASRLLQKQFVHACTCSMIICYLCSYIIGTGKGLWYLFPWSWTGIRAVFIFVAIFPIYLNRKINLHGKENLVDCFVPELYSTLPDLVFARLVSARSARNLIAYSISAVILCRIYLNNCTTHQSMGLLITHKSYELPRLNERWLYFHVLALSGGVLASLRHTLRDLDLLQTSRSIPIPIRLRLALPDTIRAITLLSGSQITASPFIYWLARHSLFSRVLAIVKVFYRVPKSTALPGWPVSLQILYHSLLFSFIVSLLWVSLNLFFDVYLSQVPMRKGRLPSEKSMQPDETLINGLTQESKQLTQVLALEELDIISSRESMRNRRVAIFEAGSSEPVIWNAIVSSCLHSIKNFSMRLSSFLSSGHENTAGNSAPPAPFITTPKSARTVQVQQANIFKTGVSKPFVVDQLKSHPSSVAGNQEQITELKKLVDIMRDRTSTWTARLCKPVWGFLPSDPAKQTRRLSAKIYVGHRLLIMRVTILANLLLNSLEEDSFGRVYKDVPRILLEFHSLLSMVRAFSLKYDKKDELHISEVEELHKALEIAITRVGTAFADFVDLQQYPGLWKQIHSGGDA